LISAGEIPLFNHQDYAIRHHLREFTPVFPPSILHILTLPGLHDKKQEVEQDRIAAACMVPLMIISFFVLFCNYTPCPLFLMVRKNHWHVMVSTYL